MSEIEKQQWHMSRSVNLFAVMVQTGTIIWFIANLNSSVEMNTASILRNELRISQIEMVVQTQDVTMARMDENIKAIRDAIERMETSR